MGLLTALRGKTTNTQSPASIVERLVNEAKSAEQTDRRKQERHPFFQPVTLVAENNPRCCLTAFSREISSNGIGLLHYESIEPGQYVITIQSPSGEPAQIPAEILWCQPCGEGWYLSGAKFLELE